MGSIKLKILNKRVAKEILELGGEIQASLDRTVVLMEQYGTYVLGMPYVRKLQDGLWEIRLKDKRGIARVIFVSLREDEIIILHAFRKTTQKTPPQAIALALQRMKEISYG